VNLLHARIHLEEETSSLSAVSCGVKVMPAVVTAQFSIAALLVCVRQDFTRLLNEKSCL
jgi:hypothetical protein